MQNGKGHSSMKTDRWVDRWIDRYSIDRCKCGGTASNLLWVQWHKIKLKTSRKSQIKNMWRRI